MGGGRKRVTAAEQEAKLEELRTSYHSQGLDIATLKKLIRIGTRQTNFSQITPMQITQEHQNIINCVSQPRASIPSIKSCIDWREASKPSEPRSASVRICWIAETLSVQRMTQQRQEKSKLKAKADRKAQSPAQARMFALKNQSTMRSSTSCSAIPTLPFVSSATIT